MDPGLTLISAAILLVIVVDPLGNVPNFLTILGDIPRHADAGSSCANPSSPTGSCCWYPGNRTGSGSGPPPSAWPPV
jgi:hypothetical protein